MLVRRGVYYLVLNRGRRLVGLLVNTKIVNLKPEIDLFFLLKRGRLAIGRLDFRPDLVGTDYEVSGANFAGRDRLHLVGKDQSGGSELFVAKVGNGIAAAENTSLVAVYVFHHHVKPVESRTHRQGLPIKRDVVDFLFQQL